MGEERRQGLKNLARMLGELSDRGEGEGRRQLEELLGGLKKMEGEKDGGAGEKPLASLCWFSIDA